MSSTDSFISKADSSGGQQAEACFLPPPTSTADCLVIGGGPLSRGELFSPGCVGDLRRKCGRKSVSGAENVVSVERLA